MQKRETPGQKHMLHVADFDNRWSSRLLQKRTTPGQKHILHLADFDNKWSSFAKEKDSRSEAQVACFIV